MIKMIKTVQVVLIRVRSLSDRSFTFGQLVIQNRDHGVDKWQFIMMENTVLTKIFLIVLFYFVFR